MFWVLQDLSRTSTLTPVRAEERRCHGWTEAPERVLPLFSFYTLTPQAEVSKQASKIGQVKSSRPIVLATLPGHSWCSRSKVKSYLVIGHASSALSGSLTISTNRFLFFFVSFLYLILLPEDVRSNRVHSMLYHTHSRPPVNQQYYVWKQLNKECLLCIQMYPGWPQTRVSFLPEGWDSR